MMSDKTTPQETKPYTAPAEEANLIPQVYTPKEAEILLRLSKNTVNALLNSGELRAIRCGRKWLIPRQAITEFLRQEDNHEC